jgi:hypothetical protein
MNVGEWVGAGASLLEAVAVALAGWAAWRGLTTWRHEMVTRRKAELAEETLAIFYQARDLLAWVRTPGSLGGESETRLTEDNEDDDTRRKRNAYFWPIERLNKEAEFWGRLEASRYRFRAIFGNEAAKPFERLRSIRIGIQQSARSLIRISGQWQPGSEPPGHQEQVDRWEAEIGWGSEHEDKVAKEIDAAISAIERTCRPAVTGQAI